MLADAPAHRPVLFPNGRRFDAQPLPQVCPLTRRFVRDAQHARERPAEVHGGRAGGAEQRGQLVGTSQEVGARCGALLAHRCDEPHRRGNADQRRPAHLQLPDCVRDRLGALEIARDLRFRKRTLINDPHGSAGRP